MKKSSYRRKLSGSLTLALLMCLIFVGVLSALTLSNADGVWSNARSSSGASPTCSSTSSQGDSTTDENQVRYGRPSGQTGCGSFSSRSGFGFDGANGPLVFNPGEVFLLGQLTHYNNPIRANTLLKLVDLAVTLDFTDPVLNTTLDFTMQLDETNNSANPCPYGDSTGNGCDDKVTFPSTIPDQTFEIDGVTYTLQMVGFVPGTNATCSADDTPVDNFVTGEGQQNDACLFARILEVTHDFGDAPDIAGQTLVASDGARHVIDSEGAYLGSVVPDMDSDGQPGSNASADDGDGTPDDEDGFQYIYPDSNFADGSGSIEVTVSGLPELSTACVYGWIDWDADGFSNDNNGDSVSFVDVTSNGPVELVFDSGIPQPLPIEPSFMRLRLVPGECATAPIAPNGLQTGGEVEDYKILAPSAISLHSFEASVDDFSVVPLLSAAILVFLLGGTFLVIRARREHR